MSAKRVEQTGPIADGDRERLISAIALASESVSSFWPMRTFIHHNPLHGLEHLPFDAAVRKARTLTGGRGYLANEEYRRMLA
ncbi:MAG TPA: putative inorganic carbon transporter subunit DabA, partial [Candidatus Methylomirabilis sp.]|nr:putative inorganic carbon transporter subunit DabA [Candidatus Methylomirabilis sp.]